MYTFRKNIYNKIVNKNPLSSEGKINKNPHYLSLDSVTIQLQFSYNSAKKHTIQLQLSLSKRSYIFIVGKSVK